MIDVTKGGATLKLDRQGEGERERLTFYDAAGKAALLHYWPYLGRWKDPLTGEHGSCRDDDEAFQVAAARTVLAQEPFQPDDPLGPAATKGTAPRRRRR